MKKILFLLPLFTIGLIFTSCNKDDEASSTGTSLSSNGELSGYLYGTLFTNDSVYAYGEKDNIIGRCTVEDNGKFSLILPASPDTVVQNDFPKTLASDQTFKQCKLGLSYISTNKDYDLIKTYIPNKTTTFGGVIIARFIYVDRDVTVNGTYNYSTRGYSSKETYNLTFKKGWNEYTESLISSKKITSDSTAKEMEYTSTISPRMVWSYQGTGTRE